MLFNSADLYLEAEALGGFLAEDNWPQVGRYLAKITSDVLIKSPIMSSWSYQNSETIDFIMSRKKNISPYIQIPNYIPAKASSNQTTPFLTSQLAACLENSIPSSELLKEVEALVALAEESSTEELHWVSQA